MKSQGDDAKDLRINDILTLIYELAAGKLEARMMVSENEDELDGIITGLNMLAEEIADSILEIRKLTGLLPICAWCKKLRDDSGYWKSVEEYISTHTGAEFSHSICPKCYEKMIVEEDSKKNNSNKVS